MARIQSAYLIGIKGAAMAALAQLLHARGVRVTGSDVAQRFFTQDVLVRAGIPFEESFDAAQVPRAVDVVVHSTAYDTQHPEVAAARSRGLTVLTYPEAVASIFNTGRGIAVCGSHGKTTTTAMLGWICVEAGLDPTIIVGSDVPQLGGSARAGGSDIVILEADEYQDKLQYYNPHGVVLTNIEWDHPDFFHTPDEYAACFARFIARVPPSGFVVAPAADPVVQHVVRGALCAVHDSARVQAGDRIPLAVPGEHNQCNARAALAAAECLGIARGAALHALATYRGAARRFTLVGEQSGVTVVDDYAHHPSEIRATIAAAQERYQGRRIIAAFQPHTFTRTIALRDDFSRAFNGAAEVCVMDIFGSAREQHGGITAADLATDVTAQGVPARSSGGVEETIAALADMTQSGDVVLCLGAGENDKVARGLAAVMAKRAGAAR